MLKVKLGTIFCEQYTILLQHNEYVCDWPLILLNYLYKENFPVYVSLRLIMESLPMADF